MAHQGKRHVLPLQYTDSVIMDGLCADLAWMELGWSVH